jgi:glutamate dehydrogenase (NAD(P)+)
MAVKLMKRLGRRPEATRVAIQGFGNVGSHAAKFLSEAAFPVVAVSDVTAAYYDPKGLNVAELLRYAMSNGGSLRGYTNATRIPPDELLQLEVELLIPAALGDVIHRDNAEGIRAEIIIEGANGPIAPEADQILDSRGTLILPDILANAGGVTVSYFEWVQNRQHYRWSLDRVRQELERTMAEAFENVWQQSQLAKVSLRTAAFMIALTRVQKATELAGIS